MVQRRFRDMGLNAKFAEPRSHGAAQIVQPPLVFERDQKSDGEIIKNGHGIVPNMPIPVSKL